MLCKRGLYRHAVSVRPSVTFVYFVKTNKLIFKFFSPPDNHTILVFHSKRYGNIPTDLPPPLTMASNTGGVWTEIAILSQYLASLRAVNPATGQVLSIRHRQTTVPQVVTLIAGSKRRCLLMLGKNGDVYDKKFQRYAKDNRTAHLTARSDKSVAYVSNNNRLYSTFCTSEANY